MAKKKFPILDKLEKEHEKNWIDDHEYDPDFKSNLTDEEIAQAGKELIEKFGTKEEREKK